MIPTADDWWQATFPGGRQMLAIADARDRPVKLAYGEVGSGPPLVLLHGIGSWSYNWREAIAPWSQHYRVICLDAKGHGFSDKPPEPELPGHQIIELQRSLTALVGDRPVTVIAQSLGALVALAAASRQPQQFDRLVAINVPIFLEQLPSIWMQLLAYLPLEVVWQFDRARLIRPLLPLVRAIVALARQEVVADPATIQPQHLDWALYPYVEFPGAIAKFAEELQQATQEIDKLVRGEPGLLSEVQANLGKITLPTLLLWGECDRWFPPTLGERLQQALPNARLRRLPGCGHDAAGSCADQVVPAVQEFLLKV
ncbi:MAG: alpha/beta hydrolase [Spirulinaceae cyanobacterium SM2_1_0]|nr:alpha/beta hydrolase [Spirulinaceae cyanobacterium SM2_1_0]